MHSMKSDNQILREAIRSYIKKVIRESEEEQKADAEWIVDKIATALDAATNKDKDYQYAAAFDSIKLKKLAQDIKNNKQSDDADGVLKETFLDWLASGVSKVGKDIIDRRAGYLTQAVKSDPKLQRMAREAGLNPRDFENKMYGLMQKDTSFLRALASFKWR
jgi:hypothetical protein